MLRAWAASILIVTFFATTHLRGSVVTYTYDVPPQGGNVALPMWEQVSSISSLRMFYDVPFHPMVVTVDNELDYGQHIYVESAGMAWVSFLGTTILTPVTVNYGDRVGADSEDGPSDFIGDDAGTFGEDWVAPIHALGFGTIDLEHLTQETFSVSVGNWLGSSFAEAPGIDWRVDRSAYFGPGVLTVQFEMLPEPSGLAALLAAAAVFFARRHCAD